MFIMTAVLSLALTVATQTAEAKPKGEGRVRDDGADRMPAASVFASPRLAEPVSKNPPWFRQRNWSLIGKDQYRGLFNGAITRTSESSTPASRSKYYLHDSPWLKQ